MSCVRGLQFGIQGEANFMGKSEQQMCLAMPREHRGSTIQLGKNAPRVPKPVPNYTRGRIGTARGIKQTQQSTSVWDQAAGATADRKALSAETDTAAPSHPWSPVGALEPHGECSYWTHLGSGFCYTVTPSTSQSSQSHIQMTPKDREHLILQPDNNQN